MRGRGESAAAAAPGAGVVRLPERYRGLIWKLGVGAFGLAFSISITSAILPALLSSFTSSRLLVAAVISAEGVFALTLPLVIGPWSDTFHTPLGRRRPFMLAALPPMFFALALIAFMPNFWLVALFAVAYFAAYYVYEPPYRGLYPDVLPDRVFGRAQSVQHLLRGLALGIALIGGPIAYKYWHPAPFVLAAFVTTGACGAAVVLVHEERRSEAQRVFAGIRVYLGTSWKIVRDEPYVRRFLIANTAWEATFAAASRWALVYVTKGMHQPASTASAVFATVAAGYVLAAIVAGPLGDRFGLARVIFLASFVYGGGLLAAGLAQHWHNGYYALILPVGIAGGMVMTLAWGLLFKLMPAEHRGAIAGIATTTKGIGIILGPLLVAGLTGALAPYLQATDGWQILWPLCALPVLAVIPLVGSLVRVEARTA